MLQIPYRRFKAAFTGEVTSEDCELGESGRVSNYVALINRNYVPANNKRGYRVLCGLWTRPGTPRRQRIEVIQR